MTDALDTDDPDAVDDDVADAPNDTDNYAASKYSQKSPYSLRKHNQYFKNVPNTKKTFLKHH